MPANAPLNTLPPMNWPSETLTSLSSSIPPGTATREILWNLPPGITMLLVYGLFSLSLLICAVGIFRHVELWISGKPLQYSSLPWHTRIWNLIVWSFLQKRVARTRPAGFAHTLVYLGFLALLAATTMVALQYDFGLPVFQGKPYLIVTVLSDVLGFGLILGCLIFAHRRYLSNSDLPHNRLADSSFLLVLILLCLQGFILEGLRIHVTNDVWANYSPVGLGFAKLFWALSDQAAGRVHFAMWWFHTITVLGVIAIVPYTKAFHIFASSVNLFFRNSHRPKGSLEPVGDLAEKMESGEEFTIGLGDIKDYNWKQLLDLDACTSCGRCQDACPAYNSGKPLSPKWVVLDTRNHALLLQHKGQLATSRLPTPLVKLDQALQSSIFFPMQGVSDDAPHYDDGGHFRAHNPAVQNAARAIGQDVTHRIAEEVMDPAVFWSCTTCYACVEACPVGINHVDQIIGNRRNLALMHGEIPQEAQATLRALENRSNPYGDPADRVNWLDGLDVKILSPGDKVDYLYWVGCVSAYDPRKQKIARSLAKIMKHANLSFGILGTAEGCTGDPARRLGEENLFQTMAKQNIATLQSVQFKVLVANCPHCFNTIKNEYPEFGNLGAGRSPEIIHHSQLLRRLLADGTLDLGQGSEGNESFTFHDPCYLGRYNDEYEAPRESLRKVKGLNILEMDKNKEKGMCCGAGGGHFWMDLKVGERINTLRVDQAAATGASNIATACPFCMQMLEDGVKLTDRDTSLKVKDIAEVIAEKLP